MPRAEKVFQNQNLKVIPYAVDFRSSTKKIDTRARGRFASLKIQNSAQDENWRFGSFRADVQPDGKR